MKGEVDSLFFFLGQNRIRDTPYFDFTEDLGSFRGSHLLLLPPPPWTSVDPLFFFLKQSHVSLPGCPCSCVIMDPTW